MSQKIKQKKTTDEDLEIIVKSLRPKKFQDVIGRESEKKNLIVLIEAAKRRNEALDHILLHGPPGLGKTSLAQVIAHEANVPFYTTSGPAIQRKGDLVSILSNIEDKGILFIDEIHRLHKSIEEILYSAMEDNTVDIIIGKGPSARTLKLELNDISIIGATTKAGMLSSPLRDRFGLDLRLDYYSIEEMSILVKQKAELLGINIEEKAAIEIANRSRRTPRHAVRILKRIRDLAQFSNEKIISYDLVLKGLAMLNIDKSGLDLLDRKILITIIDQFKGGPVGLNTLSAAISEDENTIQEVYEPFLLKEGFLIRTNTGRMVTEKTIKYLKNVK